MDEYQLKIIFFHELGHFIAHVMNQKYLDGLGVEEMKIFSRPMDGYNGYIKLIRPDGYVEGNVIPIDRLSQHLASLTYGCLFQSYYESEKVNKDAPERGLEVFDSCLGKRAGCDDVNKWRAALDNCNKGHYAGDVAEMESDYFLSLLKDKVLEDFMQIDPVKYLVKDEFGDYTGETGKLTTNLQIAIDKHSRLYLTLIDRYKHVLEI
ncbi:hypothetical protein [Chitinophaga tropicalis]|uniref:Uncharacterized protein n=1 Tax=Chitinophaga tropicalis TaxID=2683588 RepID=A0A7K1U6K2_9BACT|nr:hypothetical protein [Chitinophaga tropicalis]MVT09991.1 hypothetical protein [Chitinophaga tropicalis]